MLRSPRTDFANEMPHPLCQAAGKLEEYFQVQRRNTVIDEDTPARHRRSSSVSINIKVN